MGDFEGPIGGDVDSGMKSSTSMDLLGLRQSFMRKVRRKDSEKQPGISAADHTVSNIDVSSSTYPKEVFPFKNSGNIPKSTSMDTFKEKLKRFMGSKNDVSDHNDTPRTLQKVKCIRRISQARRGAKL